MTQGRNDMLKRIFQKKEPRTAENNGNKKHSRKKSAPLTITIPPPPGEEKPSTEVIKLKEQLEKATLAIQELKQLLKSQKARVNLLEHKQRKWPQEKEHLIKTIRDLDKKLYEEKSQAAIAPPTKEAILKELDNYFHWTKPSVFSLFNWGRHHSKRAQTIRNEISKTTTQEDIRKILQHQIDLFDQKPTISFTVSGPYNMPPKRFYKGSYYSAMQAALKLLPHPPQKTVSWQENLIQEDVIIDDSAYEQKELHPSTNAPPLPPYPYPYSHPLSLK